MGIKVLIADDHAIVRDGLRALLEDFPEITVVGDAADGLQAVDQARELQPDLVLMDISMPGLSGIEATRQLLKMDRPAQVIILSMLNTPEHVSEALEAGAQGYLLKESAGREVVDAILAVASGKIYLSQQVKATLISDYLRLRSQARPKDPLEALSERERQILLLVLEGMSSADIGKKLNLSPKTIESYRSRMMKKLGVEEMAGLFKFALHAGLIK